MSELIDNRAQRIRTLKEIIRHLHSGAPAEQVKNQLRQIVKQTDAGEIMAMEQELLAEGMTVDQVRSMCDLHSQVTREVLVQISSPQLAPGHPVDTFRRENEALQQVLTRMRAAVVELRALAGGSVAPAAAGDASAPLVQWRQAYNDIMDVEKHYQRKEHALFPFLEKHGIAGPSKVMWAKDDEIRGMLKQLGEAGESASRAGYPTAALCALALDAAGAVEEMIFKEEQILLPLSLNTLTEEEWGEVWASSPRYGWCLVEPRQGYAPPAGTAGEANVPSTGALVLPSGHLSVEQLAAIFSALPLDLTFVDADDRVAFFTEGPDRIFARSQAIIGRKVQNCHPPSSVAVVERILSDFRAGRQNVAEFWLSNFQGKYVHIRYFAVRDPQGKYLGTLELTQDIKPLREIQGDRRLLEYETAKA